jgi:hypothetical protein
VLEAWLKWYSTCPASLNITSSPKNVLKIMMLLIHTQQVKKKKSTSK